MRLGSSQIEPVFPTIFLQAISMRKKTFGEIRRALRLNKLYTIHGDGIARLKIHEAVKDWRFRKNVKALKDMKIEGE